MKHICLYFESYYVGGLDTFTTQLINNLPDENYEITLLCNKSHSGASYFKSNISNPSAHVEIHDMIMQRDWAEKLFKDNNSILYKLTSYISYILLIPYYILYGYKRLKMNRFDKLMVINGGYPAALSCRCIPISWYLYKKEKAIMNFHSQCIKSRFLLKPFDFIIDTLLYFCISNFISVSKSCAETLRIRRPFRNINNIKFIYNGIDEKKIFPTFNLKENLNINKDDKILIMLATYEPHKGHIFILNVFKELLSKTQNIHLIFCGYGSQKEMNDIKYHVEKLGIKSKVSILGYQQNAMEFLIQSDILLIGSQMYESFGLTAIEAMKYKKVIISTNIGGLKEVIKNDEGGYTFEKNDIKNMADKIHYLLENPEEIKTQGEKGFQRFIKNFTINKMIEGYCKYL